MRILRMVKGIGLSIAVFFGFFWTVPSVSAQIAFDPPRNFDGGDGMRALESVDLNGDGFLDLAAASKSSGMLSVFLNNGNATFSGPVDYLAGIFPFDVASGDFNLDGSPDLAVANAASNNVSVFLNNGDGTFQAAQNFLVGLEPQGVAAGDLNGDGLVDIAAANTGSNSVTILLNDGTGGFTLGGTLDVGPNPVSLIIADLSGNGHLDLAAVNNGRQFVFISPIRVRHFGTVSVILNNGFGIFAGEKRYEVSQNPFQATVFDLDNDGDLDLATANHVSSGLAPHNWISVLRNSGPGTFAAAEKVATQTHQGTITAGDLNGDGWTDLISSNTSLFQEYEVMVNNNGTSFGASQKFPIGAMNGVQDIVTGDFDMDGDVDVVAASADTDMLGLYLNQVFPNAPVVVGTPDLIVTVVKNRVKTKKGTTQLEVQYRIENIGDGPAANWGGGNIWLSSDTVLDTGDTFVKSFFLNTAAGLLAGQSNTQKLKKSVTGDLTGMYIIVRVDAWNQIDESNETNNLAIAQIN